MLKLKIFDVYINKALIKSLKIKDIDKVVFVKEGISWAYFAMFYNIIHSLKRGFKTFAILLLLAQAMLIYISKDLPIFYAILLYVSFSIFIGNLSNDIERFFLKLFKMQKITEIVAKTIADAQDRFFVNFYPEYLKFLEKKKTKNNYFNKGEDKNDVQNDYFQPNKQEVFLVRNSTGFVGATKNLFNKVKQSFVDLKNTKIGVFKGRR